MFARYDRYVADKARAASDSYSQRIFVAGLNYKLRGNISLRLENQFNHGYALPVASGEMAPAAAGPTLGPDRRRRAFYFLKHMMFRKRMGIGLLTALLAVASTWSAAGGSDFVVIVNKANRSTFDKGTVAKIYSGELVAWPDGTRVAAVDLPENDPTRINFSRDVLGKTVSSVKTLWAQLVFSGRALPPKQAATDEDVKKFVVGNRGGIGYIRPSSVDESVRAEN